MNPYREMIDPVQPVCLPAYADSGMCMEEWLMDAVKTYDTHVFEVDQRTFLEAGKIFGRNSSTSPLFRENKIVGAMGLFGNHAWGFYVLTVRYDREIGDNK